MASHQLDEAEHALYRELRLTTSAVCSEIQMPTFRTLRYPIILGVTAALVIVLTPYLEVGARWIYSNQLDGRPSPSLGICAALISSAVGFAYVLLTQNRRKKGVIRRYRYAEEQLMRMGKMQRPEILQYHGSYNWNAYAGLGFSTLFILVPLFFTDQIKLTDPLDKFAVFLGKL